MLTNILGRKTRCLAHRSHKHDDHDEASMYSKPSVPLNDSNKKIGGFSKQLSNSSLNRDTIEEESKINSDDYYKEANLFYFENDEF